MTATAKEKGCNVMAKAKDKSQVSAVSKRKRKRTKDKLSKSFSNLSSLADFLPGTKDLERVKSSKPILKRKRKRTKDKLSKAFSNLSSLADFLPATKDLESVKSSKPILKVLRSKNRQQIVVQESKQLAAVLGHAEYQSNPFSAIHQHLLNTLPSPTTQVQSQVLSKARDNSKIKKKKAS